MMLRENTNYLATILMWVRPLTTTTIGIDGPNSLANLDFIGQDTMSGKASQVRSSRRRWLTLRMNRGEKSDYREMIMVVVRVELRDDILGRFQIWRGASKGVTKQGTILW